MKVLQYMLFLASLAGATVGGVVLLDKFVKVPYFLVSREVLEDDNKFDLKTEWFYVKDARHADGTKMTMRELKELAQSKESFRFEMDFCSPNLQCKIGK